MHEVTKNNMSTGNEEQLALEALDFPSNLEVDSIVSKIRSVINRCSPLMGVDYPELIAQICAQSGHVHSNDVIMAVLEMESCKCLQWGCICRRRWPSQK
jgi:hypothetical protein